MSNISKTYHQLSPHFSQWEKIKDLIDQNIDFMLNFAQSGHPGGSRSKVHLFVALVFSQMMRWDIHRPELRFADRFILSAGHTCPLVYASLALFNEALRIKYEQTGDARYAAPYPDRTLYWEDLLGLRRRGGLPGHAEMKGKTLFFKWNTGPSGHGIPPATGQAFALKRAGAGNVKVLVFEGEGGLTPGHSHESKNFAWSLGLDNLYFFVDWNCFGIDDNDYRQMVHGTPADWFEPYGFRVFGTMEGDQWEAITQTLLEMFLSDHEKNIPSMMWVKTRKGRGYKLFDNKSHGAPHKANSDLFWKTKIAFAEKYNVEFDGFGEAAPPTQEAFREQTAVNLQKVAQVLRQDSALVDYITETLLDSANQVPQTIESICINPAKSPLQDPALSDFQHYPADLFLPPGTKKANRNALAKFGAWVNAYCHKNYGRPLFIACSADLAGSTQVSGFAAPYGDFEGYGWYRRDENPSGVLLPQPITEFSNAGLIAGLATVNFSETPYDTFDGFYGICSTFSAFSYLKYGSMRLFSQVTTDSEIQTGKVIWVAGHSGPETGEDARTHYGIFSPGVTQLFPADHILNLHPWEYNEVPVVLGAALASDYHLIAIHLNRPNYAIPDREKLGMDSHFDAAKGAYLIRDFTPDLPKAGTLIVQGASATNSVVQLLPVFDEMNLNVKIVAAISWQLFQRQPQQWRDRVLPMTDWLDSTVITNGAKRLMHDWMLTKIAEEYAMSADFDDQWRTSGKSDEMVDEAHLSPEKLLPAIQKFVTDRDHRLSRLQAMLESASY